MASTTTLTGMEKPFLLRFLESIGNRWSICLDRSTPHTVPRWLSWLMLLLLFAVRIYAIQGFFIVVYGLGIYLLNLLIGFLAPSESEAEILEAKLSGVSLPLRADDEYRPFSRRLPEFKVWLSACKATVTCMAMTLFSVFDIPVFWPVLLMYFCVLFALTMKRQIKHMIKFKYLPFSFGKKHYAESGGITGLLTGAGKQHADSSKLTKKGGASFQRPLPKVRRPMRSMPDTGANATLKRVHG